MKSLFLVFALLLFTGCSTLDVKTDYDPEYSFEGKKSFAILNSKKEGVDSLNAQRIDEAIIDEMGKKGYKNTMIPQADLLVMYSVNVQSKTQLYTDYQMVGVHPRYGGGMMISTTRSYDYEEGKLVLSVVDAQSKSVVWESVATDELNSYDDPQEKIDYINQAIAKVLKAFPLQTP